MPGVVSQRDQGLFHADAGSLADDRLGLLDDDAAVEGVWSCSLTIPAAGDTHGDDGRPFGAEEGPSQFLGRALSLEDRVSARTDEASGDDQDHAEDDLPLEQLNDPDHNEDNGCEP